MADIPTLAVNDLSVDFVTTRGRSAAVSAVGLSIARGELHALVGESGSGKSVTARAIMGLLPRTAVVGAASRIRLAGTEIAGAPEPRLRALRGSAMAMIFQEPMSSLNPVYTIGRQLAEAIAAHQRLSRSARLAHAAALLDEAGLSDPAAMLARYPHQLSGGQRQRVMIAVALANRPALLIADEPTTALDVIVQAQILTLLADLRARYAMAVLLITHDLTIVRRYADRVSVMRAGRIVESGPAATLLACPQHPYTRMLLDAEPTAAAPPRPTRTDKPLLTATALTVAYEAPGRGWRRRVAPATVAVNDASLSVGDGEAVGIVGESGSGKTSLGLALLRLIASEGTITFAGARLDPLDRAAMRPWRRQLQVVLQDPFASLNPRLSVRQIVEEGLIINRVGSGAGDRLARVQAALGDAGLPDDILSRFPHEFSGGQRQRLSIARAIVLEPRFLLLDEPTSALDLSVQAEILKLLGRLQRERGLTYLFISHDLKVVRAVCQRVIVMKAGAIVEHGPTAEVLARPRTDYAARLIKAAFDVTV